MEKKHLERLHSLSREIEAAYSARIKGTMRKKILATAHGRIWVKETYLHPAMDKSTVKKECD